MEQQEKKSIFKKWWFWVVALIAISIVVSSLNDSKEKAQQTVVQPEQKTEPITTEKTNPTPVIEKAKIPSTPTKTETKTTTTVNTPAQQTDRASMLIILKANASTKWGDNYEMVKYEYDNQVKAYDWVVSQTAYPDIMAKSKQKWGNNYEMVQYEYNNQVEAYKSL